MQMNAFRVLADVCHAISKCILIWAIHSNRSTEGRSLKEPVPFLLIFLPGVSLLTQLMYATVFVTRYLDLFWVPPSHSYWNVVLKIFYISSSIYIIFLMMRVYARTREREKSWRLAAYLNVGAVMSAPILPLVLSKKPMSVYEVIWYYSIVIEAFCILPQLILLRQTTVPTVIDSYYLVALGSYRFFYIVNWIYRGAHKDEVEPVKIIFGVIQVAFYLDFAWVYYSRQRVKLRAGGVVDTDDLRKGFLVNRFINARTSIDDEETPADESNTPGQINSGHGKTINRWGNRGISISADDTLSKRDRERARNGTRAQDGKLPSPNNFAEDDDDTFLSDGADDAPVIAGDGNEVLNSGTQWQSNPGS